MLNEIAGILVALFGFAILFLKDRNIIIKEGILPQFITNPEGQPAYKFAQKVLGPKSYGQMKVGIQFFIRIAMGLILIGAGVLIAFWPVLRNKI